MKQNKNITISIVLIVLAITLICLALFFGGGSMFVPKSNGLGITFDWSNPWSFPFFTAIGLLVIAAMIFKNSKKRK